MEKDTRRSVHYCLGMIGGGEVVEKRQLSLVVLGMRERILVEFARDKA